MDNKWEITDNYEKAIPFSDVVLITVPTPVNDDNSPNLTMSILPYLVSWIM